MDFAFTPEQEELRDQARAFLAANPEPSWQELAELGWTGVSVAEEHGGAGLGFLEEAILFEEMGRALTHAPYWSTVAVTLPALPADLQAEVARGEASWTLATGPARRRPRHRDAGRVRRRRLDLGARGRGARGAAARTTRRGRSASSRAARPGRQLASSELLPQLRARSLTALALEACGVGARALELAVDYAKERQQFGKPIGTYQAISHPLATTLMELELGRSLALFAAWCIAEGDERAPIAAAVGEVALRRRGRRRLRAVDPGPRRHRLHLGARPAPALQARALDPVLGGVERAASLRGGRPSARRRREVTCRD